MSEAARLPLRAENNPKFYSRFKWLGLGAIALMLWSLYDAYITYPVQLTQSEAVLTIAEEKIPSRDLEELKHNGHGRGDYYKKVRKLYPDFPEAVTAWETLAGKEGWPTELPSKLRTYGDIYFNYGMAILGGVAGFWFLLTVWRTNGRWFELSAEGITSRWGEAFSLDQVTSIDKKQWRDKGIARVRYKDAKGRAKTFVVDNYKYHKKTTDRILYQIEQHVGVEKIKGGKPDADPDAPKPEQPVAAEA